MLVSGSGSNLQALLDAGDDLGAEIVLVLSDKADAYGLERARGAGIPAAVVRWADHADRAAFTTAVCDAIQGAGAEAVVLAGFMRILSAEAVERFPLRILNIHPSLLPSFPGAHAVEDSLAHGAKVTGVTVHFVDEGCDTGPIILQEPVEIQYNDTIDSLRERIHAVEHRLLPQAIELLSTGKISFDEKNPRRVIIKD